jgi:hypothetical protein
VIFYDQDHFRQQAARYLASVPYPNSKAKTATASTEPTRTMPSFR